MPKDFIDFGLEWVTNDEYGKASMYTNKTKQGNGLANVTEDDKFIFRGVFRHWRHEKRDFEHMKNFLTERKTAVVKG